MSPAALGGFRAERQGSIDFLVGRAAAVEARHGHHVAEGEGVEHLEKLPPVVVRARHLLPVNLAASRAA